MHSYSIDTEERRSAYFVILVIAFTATYFSHGPLSTLFGKLPEPIHDILDAPTLAAIFGIIFSIYDGWLWRQRLGSLRFSRIPNFNGAYQGTLSGNFSGKERSVDLNVIIKQRWSKIRMVGQTLATEARSEMAFVSVENQQLRYEFVDEPKASHANEYHMHRGVSFLTLVEESFLTGGYYNYNGRSSHGDIELERS